MTEDLDFRHFLGTLRRSVVFVIVTALLVGGAAFLTSKLQTPKYRATETLLFAPADSNVNPVDHARAISTLTSLAKTERVLGSAAKNLGIPTAELEKAISVSGTDTEDLIKINAVANRGTTAASYARAVGTSFIAWRKSIQNDLIRARITSLQDQLTQLSGRTSPSAVAAAGAYGVPAMAADAEGATKLARVIVEGDEITIDLTGSNPEVPTGYNVPFEGSLLVSCYYAVRTVLLDEVTFPEHVPQNDGVFRPVKVIAPKGTIYNPNFPRACFSRFCQTQRVVDNVRRLAEAGEMLLAAHPGAERLRFDVITVDGLRITHKAIECHAPLPAGLLRPRNGRRSISSVVRRSE